MSTTDTRRTPSERLQDAAEMAAQSREMVEAVLDELLLHPEADRMREAVRQARRLQDLLTSISINLEAR